MVNAINDGRITPAPPRSVPNGILSVDDLAKRIQPRTFPAWLSWLMRNRLWVFLIVLALLLRPGSLLRLINSAALALASTGGFSWLQQQSVRSEDGRGSKQIRGPERDSLNCKMSRFVQTSM